MYKINNTKGKTVASVAPWKNSNKQGFGIIDMRHDDAIRKENITSYANSDVRNSPIQRAVDSFKAHGAPVGTPPNQLLNNINPGHFQNSNSLFDKIRQMGSPHTMSYFRPSSIDVVFDRHDSTQEERTGNAIRNVGAMGRDEFWLKNNGQPSVFHGGHLVAHSIWNENDDDIQYMDSYENLVPMSAEMNTTNGNEWKRLENHIMNVAGSLSGKKTLKAKIDVSYNNTYFLNNGLVGRLFNEPVQPGLEGNPLAFSAWIPSSIKYSEKAVSIEARESDRFGVNNGPITNGNEFRNALINTPIYGRLNPHMMQVIGNL